jgi:hypothetical protein
MAKDPAWQESLEAFKMALANMRDGDVLIPQNVRDIFTQTDTSAWDNNRRVFVFGQLDADKMTQVCREGLLPWWPVLTGRVYQGDLEGVKKVLRAIDQDAGKSEKPNLTSAMSWVVYPHIVCDGFSNTISPSVIRHLLSKGADANGENGKWLEFALKNLDAEGIKPFLDYGAASGTILRAMDELQKNQKFAQLGKIQDALAHSAFVKIDADTLMEAKYVPDARGCSVFKTLFNFRARRVHEIYETGNGAQAVMQGLDFRDYDAEALKYAEEKLKQLGGKPRPPELDKPVTKPLTKGLQ